jgi:tetratricopeptide (TPR) repeat protein
MQDSNEKKNANDGIDNFFQKNRKPVLVTLCVLVLAVIVCIVVFYVRDVLQNKAINAVEELAERYEKLRPSLDNEESASSADGAIAELRAELEDFAQKNSGYAGSRAWFIAANIYSEKKEWALAETAWVNAAKKNPKSYMAPLAWFNAGASAEEQGKTVEAIAFYENSILAPAGFSSAPRAQFSIGRLWESLGEEAAAIDAYRAVIADWPKDPVWPNIAHTRVISLEAKNTEIEPELMGPESDENLTPSESLLDSEEGM